MATIFLVRHGEAEVTGVFLGQMDPGLSALGWTQAHALADLNPAVIWCSPLLRARQTADCIACRTKILLQDLRELAYGEWTGKTWAEIEDKWPEIAGPKSADWLAVTPPGAEPWQIFLKRVEGAWQQIKSGPFPAAIVAHQGVNAALAHLMDGRDPLQFAQAHGEAIRVEYD